MVDSSICIEVEKSNAKPFGNLTKKGFAKMCEYITTERPGDSGIINLISRAMTHAFNFSPDVSSPPEISRRNYETRKDRLKSLGQTEYERYVKPKSLKRTSLGDTTVRETVESKLPIVKESLYDQTFPWDN